MIVPDDKVAEVVAEASLKMKDPNYSAVLVGGFVQIHHPTAQYISTYEADLGGMEAVLEVIFLASLIGLCYQRAHDCSIPRLSFRDLDAASHPDNAERLERAQPAIKAYIDTNMSNPIARKVLYLIALAMDMAMQL